MQLNDKTLDHWLLALYFHNRTRYNILNDQDSHYSTQNNIKGTIKVHWDYNKTTTKVFVQRKIIKLSGILSVETIVIANDATDAASFDFVTYAEVVADADNALNASNDNEYDDDGVEGLHIPFYRYSMMPKWTARDYDNEWMRQNCDQYQMCIQIRKTLTGN